MKKALFTCLTGTLLTWAITSVSYSQSTNSTARIRSSGGKFISSSEEIKREISNPGVSEKINAKAVKNFTRAFKNVTDAQWFTFEDGFVVYFTSDGINTRVFYDKKGNNTGMIRAYFEDKLPTHIRHLVKSAYYDFSIYHVNEVTANKATAYLVKIEDNTSWKTIRVVDGEMDVLEAYSKR